jgi:hypothetical protein
MSSRENRILVLFIFCHSRGSGNPVLGVTKRYGFLLWQE